jgi:thiamine-phosphate pyrophosphorylase
LWLFTDARRVADPRPVVARLPKGLAGVVLRHDGESARAALGRDLARLCRARRLRLVVAGDPRLAAALGAGVHVRGGRWPAGAPVLARRRRRGALLTSSAHSLAELRRAARAGADLAFLSPAFATRSHPDAAALGPLRWGRLARGAALPVAALGGIGGASVRRLPRDLCRGAGAIEALAEAVR